MDIKEIERVVNTIQNHIFKNANSFSTGMLRSTFKGTGLQFREHQLYIPGDDVRFIDWNLSAKTSNVYIKTFEEDRNVEIVVFIDLSPSLSYGANLNSKFKAITEITCLLYLLAAQTQDKVRLILWNGDVTTLKPSKGKEGITAFVDKLQKLKIKYDFPEAKSLYNHGTEKQLLLNLKKEVSRQKEVVYLGDLSNIDDKNEIKRLLSKKNFHLFRILSPIDKSNKFPFLLRAQSASKAISGYLDTVETGRIAHERYSELDVSERYLENFVRELVV